MSEQDRIQDNRIDASESNEADTCCLENEVITQSQVTQKPAPFTGNELVFGAIPGYDFGGLFGGKPADKGLPPTEKPLAKDGNDNALQVPADAKPVERPEAKPEESKPQRPDDKQVKPERPAEKVLPPKPVSEETQQAITRLERAAADNITNQADRERFQADLTRFRGRVGRDLSEAEFRRTLDSVRGLLEAGDSAGGQSRERRVLGAQGLMYNFGNPGEMGQLGSTCGVASIERTVADVRPSLVADMVSSTLRTGSWTGPDGVRVQVPEVNLTPEGPQRHVPPSRGEGLSSHPATYASQVFQATMVNELGQHLNPPLRYERRGNQEHWVRPDGARVDFSAAGSTGQNGEQSLTGGLPSALVVTGLRRITGQDSRILVNPNFDLDRIPTADNPVTGISGAGVERITSAAELQQALERMQRNGNFPAIVSISSGGSFAVPFANRPAAQENNPQWIPDHFATVHSFNPGQPPTVTLRNSWGQQFNGTVSVDFLFRAMGTQPQRRN